VGHFGDRMKESICPLHTNNKEVNYRRTLTVDTKRNINIFFNLCEFFLIADVDISHSFMLKVGSFN